ncbi:MAG: hypothetical protein JWP57_567 [Spirosoma sp.]|nr:hypothetical protein [Spirosoma sp.]
MKRCLLALLILTGCSKSESYLDSREQYLGTYVANSSYKYYYGEGIPPQTGKSSGVITVKKDKEAQKIYFIYAGYYTTTATLTGSKFVLDPRTDASGVVVTGSGSFTGNTFSYSTVAGSSPNTYLFTSEISGTRQ